MPILIATFLLIVSPAFAVLFWALTRLADTGRIDTRHSAPVGLAALTATRGKH